MEHSVYTKESKISVRESETEESKDCTLSINGETITITPKQLHSFIGTLLHVQAKIKQ